MADTNDFENLINALADAAAERVGAEIRIYISSDGSGYIATDEPLSTKSFRGPHSGAAILRDFISENAK